MSSSAEPGAPRALEQRAFDEWPPSLRALFDGTQLAAKIGFTASLLTSGAGGHIRTSLLGIGELYAPDSRCLAFSLWPTSRAAHTLSPAVSAAGEAAAAVPDTGAMARAHAIPSPGDRRRTLAALTFVYGGSFYQVQLAVEKLRGAEEAADPGNALAHFVGSIETGEAQQVGYAHLTSGVTFELAGEPSARKAVLDRWERQIDTLRQATHAWLAGGR